jgi:hypothetical protein
MSFHFWWYVERLREGEEKKARIQGRINSFDDAF